MDWFGLNGKKYLVTGASSGIGQAAAIKISQLGGKVILNGRNLDRLQQTLSMMDGDGHFVMPYDLTDLDGIKGYVTDCVQTDGSRFDGLVFSTGIARDVPIRSETLEHLCNLMNVNYFSYFALLKAFSSRKILNDKGSIVAVSSAAARNPAKAQAGYSGSKAAIDATTVVASHEFAGRKVRVNSVQPGMTYTPMVVNSGYFEKTTEHQRDEWYPLGTLSPEDIAGTVVFLLSEMSKKLTGQNIYVSAGNDGTPIDFLT